MEILERLRCFYENADCDECMLDVRDAIEELERLYAERRWIPVEERLPEVDENVLASAAGEVGIAHRYVDGWFWDVDEWHKPFTPSHWMQLPEPPEVK